MTYDGVIINQSREASDILESGFGAARIASNKSIVTEDGLEDGHLQTPDVEMGCMSFDCVC